MNKNPNTLSPRFVTIDKFQDYHKPRKLEEKTSKLLAKFPDFEEAISEIRRGRWLRLFETIHKNDDYGSFLEIIEAGMPDKKEQSMSRRIVQFFDSLDFISVLFIDGCKSWFSTKCLMKHIVTKLTDRSYVIFQDYGRHTCFWISSFLETFKENFKLIASIAGTFTFKYVKELKQSDIETRFPDDPTEWTRDFFFQLYQSVLDKAYIRSDTGAIFNNTLHMAAALAYLGFKDDARKLIKQCLQFPGFSRCRHVAESALKVPTFTPDKAIFLEKCTKSD